MLVSSTGLEDWISKKIKILPKIQDVLHLQRLESGVEQLETRVVAPIDTFRKMCISVYSIIDLYTYIYILNLQSVAVYMFDMYIYIHLHIYLFLCIYIYISTCYFVRGHVCFTSIAVSFHPFIHPFIHVQWNAINMHVWLLNIKNAYLDTPRGAKRMGKGAIKQPFRV